MSVWRSCLSKGMSYSSKALIYTQHGDPRQVLQLSVDKVEDIRVSEKSTSPSLFSLKDEKDERMVEVDWIYSPINPADLNMIEGVYGKTASSLSAHENVATVAGSEGIGRVRSIGSAVTSLCVGDAVHPLFPGSGLWRQSSRRHEFELFKAVKHATNEPLAPEDWLVLATNTVNPATAYRMLKDFTDPSKDHVVIQNGANSAVGQYLIQMAAEMGIMTVNVIRDRPEPELSRLRSYLQNGKEAHFDRGKQSKGLGGHLVLTESEAADTGAAKSKIKQATGGALPTVAYNCVSGASATNLVRLLSESTLGPRMVTYGAMSKRPISLPSSPFIFQDLSLHGFWVSRWYLTFSRAWQEYVQGLVQSGKSVKSLVDLDSVISLPAICQERYRMMTDIQSWTRQGKLVHPPAEIYSLDDYQAALEKATMDHKNVKVLFQMNPI